MIRNTAPTKFGNSNNKIVDNNYETLKNEFLKLSQNILTIYNSLNYNNNTMKDIYLNSNSFLNNLSNYYHSSGYETEHPLGNYSNQILMNVHKTFEEWEYNQSSHFQSLNDYCNQIEQIKSKIESLDSNTNIESSSQEYQALKNQIFKDVQHLFESRVNQFDIPLINIQFSFNNCLQSLNSNHNDSSFLLQQPINFNNPVQSLQPINTTTTNNNTAPHRPSPPLVNKYNNNNNNNLQQIPRPTLYVPPKQYVPPQQQQYTPPQPYSPPPPPPQQQPPYIPPHPYSPQQQQQQQQIYGQPTAPPEQPPSSGPRKGKSQLKQLERPAQVELPDNSVIEQSIKRKPGDFLRDPNAPRFVPASQQQQHHSNKPSMEHHSISLSESYKQRAILSNDINEHGTSENHSNSSGTTTKPPVRKLDNSIKAPPSRPAPMPK
ncbi:hypothetical protein RB653_005616 [Dictyostelium firmibasis]|uniref:Uncharacterized protein n=1 Tax=Dictyostelium firmibasis TaxID=79012 RepID=A0AAN7U1J8_9MYCE